MNYEEVANDTHTKDSSTWAIMLGVAAGITAASLAIGLYVKARHPHQDIRDIDEIISRVQDKMRVLQTMIDSQRKPMSAA